MVALSSFQNRETIVTSFPAPISNAAYVGKSFLPLPIQKAGYGSVEIVKQYQYWRVYVKNHHRQFWNSDLVAR